MRSSIDAYHSIAVIPARSGSKGVPDKNVRLLGGHPLLAWSIRAALLADQVDRVLVSTDSTDYAEIAKSYGAEVPFLRPVELAGDTASDLDVMRHLLDWFGQAAEPMPELLVHLRPTTPLRDPVMIDGAIRHLAANPNGTALRSVHEMPETAYKCVERDGDFLTTVFSRERDLEAANGPRQGYPATYLPNGYVDVLRTDLIDQEGRMHGDGVLAFVTPPAAEVDSEEDLEFLMYETGRRPDLAHTLFGSANVSLSHQRSA